MPYNAIHRNAFSTGGSKNASVLNYTPNACVQIIIVVINNQLLNHFHFSTPKHNSEDPELHLELLYVTVTVGNK